MTTIRFLGAAGSVTGSRFLLEAPRSTVLVDCGLFQGLKELRLRNWDAFPVAVHGIDAVVVSHAHLDHTGYLPALVRAGFTGKVYATKGTRDLSRIVLPDSGRIQEEDAAHAARKGYSKHSPVLPLYTEQDAKRALRCFEPIRFGERAEIARDVDAILHPAGHILGSSSVEIRTDGRTLLFSGDLGRTGHPILLPPPAPPPADVVVVESTYGDRHHDMEASIERFRDAISRTAEREGCIIMPSFAVDRTEVILYHLHRLATTGQIPALPIYLDSPMASAALDVYRRAIETHSPDVRPGITTDMLDPGTFVETRDVTSSKAINHARGPCIVIAGSGMATGGRVLHHLAHRLPDPRNTVMLVGFQVAGTRGRSLADGASTVKMFGRYVPVRAEVVHVDALSSHADADELLGWLRAAPSAPETTFVVHGEPASSDVFRERIATELDRTAVVPHYLERVLV